MRQPNRRKSLNRQLNRIRNEVEKPFVAHVIVPPEGDIEIMGIEFLPPNPEAEIVEEESQIKSKSKQPTYIG